MDTSEVTSQQQQQPVFIETEELAKIIASEGKVRILDCTTFFSPTDGDPVLSFRSKHIPG